MAKILVIDDDKDTLNSMCETLELEGHEILIAGNETDGLNMARTHLPDLIICDLYMPNPENGFNVVESIKNDPKTKGITFIFFTVHSKFKDIEQGLRLGAQDYLIKEMNNCLLLARIKTHIDLINSIKTMQINLERINSFKAFAATKIRSMLIQIQGNIEECEKPLSKEVNDIFLNINHFCNEIHESVKKWLE